MTVGNHTLPTTAVRDCGDGLVYCFAKWSFDVTQGAYWVLALLGFCTALFIATTGKLGNTRAFGFAGFVAIVGSIFLAVMQLMTWWIASAFIIVGVISAAMMIISER